MGHAFVVCAANPSDYFSKRKLVSYASGSGTLYAEVGAQTEGDDLVLSMGPPDRAQSCFSS